MRYLKCNKVTRVPTSYAIVDSETVPCDVPGQNGTTFHRLRLWCAEGWRLENGKATRRSAIQGKTPARFWSWIEGRLDMRRPLWLWMHKASFDLTALSFFKAVDHGLFSFREPLHRFQMRYALNKRARRRVGFLADGDPPTILHCWHHSGAQLYVCDTLNWWDMSLERLGQKFGMPKVPLPSFGDPDSAWWKRCQQDVAITRRAVEEMIAFTLRHDMGCFRPTAAGQAMQCFRHRFLKASVLLHDDDTAKGLERSAYYGGRVEPFFIGSIRQATGDHPRDVAEMAQRVPSGPVGPVHHLDVVNLYPAVMRTQPVPVKLQCIASNINDKVLTEAIAEGRAAAEVILESDGAAYPFRTHGETYYCQGKMLTALCGQELRAAFLRGHIRGTGLAAIYATANLFSDYVDYWFAQRRLARDRGDEPEAELCKTLLVSLYGKWAQMTAPWRTLRGVEAPQPWGIYVVAGGDVGQVKVYRSLGGTVQVQMPRREKPGTFPAISAWITAAGRQHMEALRVIAGVGQCYYQGVDSIYVSTLGLTRLQAAGQVDPNVMGKLKLVGTAPTMTIYGCHDYAFGDKVTHGGIAHNAQPTERGTFEQMQFVGLKTILAVDPPEGPICRIEEVEVKRNFRRGRVSPAGWVTPLKAHEVNE